MPAHTPQERKEQAEAMARQFMSAAFAAFDSEYGKASIKGHKLVMAQAEAKAVERWKNAVRMSLLCLDSTDEAIAEYDEDHGAGSEARK